MLWLHWVSTISVAVPRAGWPWITPGLFLRASPTAAELLILKWALGVVGRELPVPRTQRLFQGARY